MSRLRSLAHRPIAFWRRWEHHINLAGLMAGFCFDLIIADRPDSLTNNIYLLTYLGIAGCLIIILNLRTIKRREIQPTYQPLYLLFILQFCFGGLASNMLVLYGRSGTFAASTLFFLILIGLIIGNEFMRSRYAQLRFNIVVYYLLLLTYLIIAVPTFILHAVGTWVFLASGVLSLAIIAVFLFLVYIAVLKGKGREHQLYEVSVLVGFVFVLFNILYFFNIIPPVPLSLKESGVYHNLTRVSAGVYSGTYEPAPWYVFWRETSGTFTITAASKQATCFSAVFAPTKLATPIYHHWERYNEETNRWVDVSRLSFPISGGREGGYRGWTLANVTPGRWRCDVETQGGALIGRVSFEVVEASAAPELAEKTL